MCSFVKHHTNKQPAFTVRGSLVRLNLMGFEFWTCVLHPRARLPVWSQFWHPVWHCGSGLRSISRPPRGSYSAYLPTCCPETGRAMGEREKMRNTEIAWGQQQAVALVFKQEFEQSQQKSTVVINTSWWWIKSHHHLYDSMWKQQVSWHKPWGSKKMLTNIKITSVTGLLQLTKTLLFT